MSDFEKAYQRITGGKVDTRTHAYCEDIWNAAIASMQGEAVEYQIKILGERWTHCAKHIYDPSNPNTRALFTYPPSASAEIARLTKELEESRKDAERAWIPMNEQRPMEEHGNKVLGLADDGYVFQCEYIISDGEGAWCSITGENMTHWMPLPPILDAAIRKIGGGE